MIAFPWQLVRDGVVDAVDHLGGRCFFRQLQGDAYRKALGRKLAHVAQEISDAKHNQQREDAIADLLDVLDAYQLAHLIRPIEVAEVRRRKTTIRGGFSKGIKLFCLIGGGRATVQRKPNSAAR